MAHQLPTFAHPYYLHVPWEVDVLVPIIQMRKLRLTCKWWVRVIQEDLKEEKGCEEQLRLDQDGKTPPFS